MSKHARYEGTLIVMAIYEKLVASRDDPEEVTADSAVECMDAVTWRIAHDLYLRHAASLMGTCSRCGVAYPCRGRLLAAAGLVTASGERNSESDYWLAYARVLVADERWTS
jgi:hypothetical protein